MKTCIRQFDERDIPQVADLHSRVFQPSGVVTERDRARHRDYFASVFLESPSPEPSLSSLVCEQDGGQISGFLGVVPRRMWLNGSHLLAAISSQFIVDPASHSALIAVQLAKTFLDGPQDLSISDEATDVSRQIWEGLGGTTALLHSIYWTRPLRPAQLAVSLLRNRAGLSAFAVVAGLPSKVVDALATRLRRSQLYQSPPRTSGDDLRPDTVRAMPDFVAGDSLRVEYDDRTLDWLMERAAARRTGGHLHKRAVHDERGLIGWYVYHLDGSGSADVLQVTGKPSSIGDVLDDLFYHAWQQGATAATGRLDPRFMQAFSDKLCLFHRRGPWMVVSSRKPEFVRPFQCGEVCFSRFDGEWCLGF